MSITLNPHVQKLIRQKMEEGRYDSESDVVADALQALDERHRLIRLREAIGVADAQLARGESIPYSAHLMKRLAQEAKEAIARGDQPKFDVIP